MTEPGPIRRVMIVPCSGIGKTFGSVSREAAYDLTEELCAQETQLVALAMLVLGDATARASVINNPTITIDGCKLACAAKMVKQSGGQVAQETAVLDVYRRHKELRPEGIAELNDLGRQLAHALAEELTVTVGSLIHEKPGGQNG